MGFRTEKSDYVPVPEGDYRACLVSLVDLGHGAKYGKEQVAMQFELYALPGAPSLDENGRTRPPRVWTMPMTLSMYREAKLAKLVAGWDGLDVEDMGEDQDLEERLGTWARATIAHEARNGRVYASLASLAPLAGVDAASLPPMYNKPGLYDVRAGRCEGFDRLPSWLQAQAMASRDWAATATARGAAKVTANGDGTHGNAPVRRSRGRADTKAVREMADGYGADGGFDSMVDDIPF